MNEFQTQIRDRVRDQLTDPMIGAMIAEHTSTRGNIAHDWLIMMLAASKIPDLDQAYKNIVIRDCQIPVQIFHDRISVIDWEEANTHNNYYTIDKSGDGLGWIPEIVVGMAGELWDRNIVELQALSGMFGGEIEGAPFPTKSMVRWHEVVRWAREQLESLLRNSLLSLLDSDNASKRLIFAVFIYHTLLLYHNPVNRENDAKWNMFHSTFGTGSPITWLDFAKKLPTRSVSSISEMAGNFRTTSYVYVWDEVENTIKLARSADTDTLTDAPEYGLDSSHYDVKRVLRISQSVDVFDSTLSSLIVKVDSSSPAFTEKPSLILSPSFSSDVKEYTITVNNIVDNVTLEVEATHQYAEVDYEEREALSIGENIINIVVTSQDGLSTSYYKVTITRL